MSRESPEQDESDMSDLQERWYKELVIGQPYFAIGFVDEKLTIPSIGSFIYLGLGALEGTEDNYCFQDAYSWLHKDEEASDEQPEPGYVVLPEESLEMIADKLGLIAWLQSPHSGPASNEENAP